MSAASFTSRAAVVADPLDAASLVNEVSSPGTGAVATFIGLVRDSIGVDDTRRVVALEYSAYVEMANREMADIIREALALSADARIVALHRTGRLAVGDVCVVVAAAHAHRAAAFEACRYVIEEIKKRVPIWKREYFADGSSVWVNAESHTQ
jgi:molybdopterin synthase catalytic subunit